MRRSLQTAQVWMLLLLTPVLAFAQGGGPYNADVPMNQQVAHSPLSWWWVAVLVVAVVAFVGYTRKISRHGRPPNRPTMP